MPCWVNSSVSEGNTGFIFKEEFYLKNTDRTRLHGVINNTGLWMFIAMYVNSSLLKIFAKKLHHVWCVAQLCRRTGVQVYRCTGA
jgi:hypothetical protein